MVEAFAMIAGTALEYGERMLACLNKIEDTIKIFLMLILQSFVYSVTKQQFFLFQFFSYTIL